MAQVQHVSAAMNRRPGTSMTLYPILFAISIVHLLNDTIQAVIPAIFPILKDAMGLTYFQIGMIGFVLNITASMMQPVFGLYTDIRPSPYLLPLGMVSTFFGMLGLALAPNYAVVLASVVLVGIGSAVFHPEGSRVASMAAGPRRGLAQSIYQVGGNSGQALAPIMTALIFVPLGQRGAIWFTVIAALAFAVQVYIARWYRASLSLHPRSKPAAGRDDAAGGRRPAVAMAMFIVLLFIFARSWYHAGITSYYPFYLIEKYGLRLEQAQIFIFLFLFSGAIGTFLGGALSDRFGRRNLMIFSMLGAAPLTLLLPHVNLLWAYVIMFLNGFIILSSFSVVVVYAQELIPGKVGMVSGLTIGLAFGLGAIGAAVLGGLADTYGIDKIMEWTALLPLIFPILFLLPGDRKLRQWYESN
mgnify:CR=1 FL=1